MAEPDLPPLRDVIARHGLGARKSLGQHFLFDMNLTRRIARAGGDLSAGTVIEVGPGPGGLTRALLLEGAPHLVAIERDERCLAALAELSAAFPDRLTVISGDALETEVERRRSEVRMLQARYRAGYPLLERAQAELERLEGELRHHGD